MTYSIEAVQFCKLPLANAWITKDLRRKIEKLLVQCGGELTLGKAEEHLRTTLRPQVLCLGTCQSGHVSVGV